MFSEERIKQNDYKWVKKYATLARQAAAEDVYFWENEKLSTSFEREGESVAVFGSAWHFIIIKSGLGSGGLSEYEICSGNSGCAEGV